MAQTNYLNENMTHNMSIDLKISRYDQFYLLVIKLIHRIWWSDTAQYHILVIKNTMSIKFDYIFLKAKRTFLWSKSRGQNEVDCWAVWEQWQWAIKAPGFDITTLTLPIKFKKWRGHSLYVACPIYVEIIRNN